MSVVSSPHGFDDTVRRLERTLKQEKFTIFATVDHAAGAKKVGMTLRPTTVIIFGDPKVGTQLMAQRQTAGIDLPMKLLVWENDEGRVVVGYNTPLYLADRHHIEGKNELLSKMGRRLPALIRSALASK